MLGEYFVLNVKNKRTRCFTPKPDRSIHIKPGKTGQTEDLKMKG